jgi:uncharacterized protein involved in outer membrane biogenesis
MKKWLIRILLVLVAVVALGIVTVSLFLDAGIKRGIETVGPMLTKTTVKLDGVSLSLFSGSGKIKGLEVRNPEGYKTLNAIKVGSASFAIQPSSLFSDKVIIKSIKIEGPEITYETNFKRSNFAKLRANLQEVMGAGRTSASGTKQVPGEKNPADGGESKATRKLQVDEFVISGAKVNVSVTSMEGRSLTMPLVEIRLANLGQGPDGISPQELVEKALEAIEKGSAQAASATDLNKQVNALTKDAEKQANETAEKAAQGLGNLFKKK